ncbi:hypothetical protein EXIGLDRAFT_835886 [Exidia glandulosa HHB12029]|uniref:Arrestin-like N-terminal domain-containing protein n=1 Tax=Exidia glandulosa HHB12029 TaxID=1314781 RepID=A0A165IDF8_EXIGL|nr:hypothetical protein EXIGLDRAFT_835886 [Exidia glandulosa HHB12029]
MLSTLRARVKLQPYQNVLFLHPPNDHDAEQQQQDHVLWGTIALALPKSREVHSVVVQLVAYYTLAIPGHAAESGILAEYSTELTVSRMLDKGEHTFAWSLAIPRTAPSQERCSFGRVYHRLHAIVDCANGALKDDVPLLLTVNHAPDGETLSLNEGIAGHHDEVGPYIFTLTAGHLTVGGVVHFTMSFTSVPTDMRIYSVSAHIVQSYILESPTKPGLFAKPAPHRRRFFTLDCHTGSKPDGASIVKSSGSQEPAPDGLLGFVPAGESLEISRVARVPNDDLVRGSTQPRTRGAPIRLSHVIEIEVRFSGSHGEEAQRQRALKVQCPITLSSCCCMLESLLLPSYSDVNPDEETRNLKANVLDLETPLRRTVECTCGFTLERLLLAQTHAPILQAHEDIANGFRNSSNTDVFMSSKISPHSTPSHVTVLS